MPRAERLSDAFGDIASQFTRFVPRPCGGRARERSHCFARLVWRHRVAQSFCKAKTLGTSFALRRVRAAILWYGNTRIASPCAFPTCKSSFIASLGVFSARKSSFIASPACFRLAKVFSSLPRSVFGSQKFFRRLLGVFPARKSSFIACHGAFSDYKSIFHRFPEAFSDCESSFVASLGVFPARKSSFVASLGVFGDIVSLRVFAKQKLSGLHSLCAASVRRFYGAGTLASLARGARRHRAAIRSLCAASVRRFLQTVFENHSA